MSSQTPPPAMSSASKRDAQPPRGDMSGVDEHTVFDGGTSWHHDEGTNFFVPLFFRPWSHSKTGSIYLSVQKSMPVNPTQKKLNFHRKHTREIYIQVQVTGNNAQTLYRHFICAPDDTHCHEQLYRAHDRGVITHGREHV